MSLSFVCNKISQPLSGHTFAYKYLGLVPYQAALALQYLTVQRLQQQLRQSPDRYSIDGHGLVPNIVYLCVHKPVYTAGRRIRGSDISEGTRLRSLGAEYYEVQRGGQTTFHGPGQLVGYPILHLRQLNISVRCYVSLLERGLIRLCNDTYGLPAQTNEHTGVWIGHNKIAALGVHVSHSVTLHGFSLNVSTDLSWFSHIVPCGITDKGVTSLIQELGTRYPHQTSVVSIESVIPELLQAFNVEWSVAWSPLEIIHPEWNDQVEQFIQSHNS